MSVKLLKAMAAEANARNALAVELMKPWLPLMLMGCQFMVGSMQHPASYTKEEKKAHKLAKKES